MASLFLRLLVASVCAVAGSAAVRHAASDARATGTLDEIAKRRDSRVPPVAPPRDIHEPERVHRTRRSAKAQSGAFPAPRAATSNAPVSFTGFLGLLDNFTAIPPDTTGAVGPQHVVTMLNTQVHIQSRTGAGRANYPISLNAFWSPLGAAGDTFDPRIQYDAAADRWIACAGVNPESQTSALLVAVSQTSDPGGAWSYFKVNIGPNNWGDYPVLGFNGNWIVVSINQFRVRNNAYMGTTLYVFSKADLYRGGTGSNISFTDASGELIPVRDFDNRPDLMYFVQTFAGGQGVFRLLRLQGQPGSESFGAAGADVRVDDGWADYGSRVEGDVAPQLGSSAKIDAGDSRIQNCVMRSGMIWCAHTIFVPAGKPNRAAIQWFQLDPTGPAILQRGRLDDETRSVFYAYPSIAVNRNNDMLVGFTRFAETEHAAAAFAFRVASDPPGALEPEVVYKRGEAPYAAPGSRTSSNRWGDYSLAVVDPADDLTFWTLQEYASTPPENQHGQFGVWWAKVTAPSAGLRCAYSLSSSALTAGPAVSTATVNVTTTPGCPWMAASNTPWIQVSAGNPGTGNGAVTLAVAANANPNGGRTGTITIAGQTFTVTQSPPPVGVDLSITSVSAPVTAEPGQSVTISATVANSSATAAVAFRVGLYLGVGPKIASRDTLLSTCTISALAPQTTAICTRTVPIPTAIQAGRYVIGAIADDQAAISDPNLTNNSATSDSGPITIASPTVRPSLPSQGIVSAASFQGGAVAPGEIVTLFGTNLGPSSPQFPTVDAQGNVATIAGGTRVWFDGAPAPMLYAAAGQASAVVPLSVRTATQVQVEYLGTRSDPVTIPVTAAAPAIFTANGSGKGPGAILNEDLSVNSTANAAHRGSAIVVYATGGGAIPGLVEGRLAQPPYAQMAPLPTVRIGGIRAQIVYAGVAPGLIAGMLQINAVVPSDAPVGGAVPIELSVGEIPSPAGVTVAIR